MKDYEAFWKKHSAYSFSQLRGLIVAFDPLNVDLVRKLNAAELSFWEQCQGWVCGPSHTLLRFDCGGRQHVKELVLRMDSPGHDLDLASDLLGAAERLGIAAHSPIEQRWSSGSRSLLSPVYTEAPEPEAAPFTWINFIMYLTDDDSALDAVITEAFDDYYVKMLTELSPKYELREHLAKTEVADSNRALLAARNRRDADRLRRFAKLRAQFDPKAVFLSKEVANILGQEMPEKKRV